MNSTMRAAILKDINEYEVVNVPVPQIKEPDEVIIKVLVCSICGTDVSFTRNPNSVGYGDMRGKILGHEIVGEIVEVGSSVTGLQVGQRVVVNPNSYCCKCASCRSGYRNHCENMELMGITVPGGFAEYVKSKEFLTFPIAREVPLQHAAFAEPLSCAMNGFSRLDITPGDTCVVFGCGPIGLMFAQLARRNGARVACIEPTPGRQAVAKQLGFDVYAPGRDVINTLAKKWGRRANYCIDAAGGQLGVALAWLEYRGTVLCFAGTSSVENDLANIQGKEANIKGSFIINDSMPKAITVLENGYLDLDPMVTHYLSLDEISKGVELMKSGEGMEIIIQIAQEEK
jgi:threonine dehydrogenase-like Zn-dependent dehydrogenase